MNYINYYFSGLSYNDQEIKGKFSAPDYGVSCCFSYNRNTQESRIWDNNKPVQEITPLPIHWLLYKLKENGSLNENESKISY